MPPLSSCLPPDRERGEGVGANAGWEEGEEAEELTTVVVEESGVY